MTHQEEILQKENKRLKGLMLTHDDGGALMLNEQMQKDLAAARALLERVIQCEEVTRSEEAYCDQQDAVREARAFLAVEEPPTYTNCVVISGCKHEALESFTNGQVCRDCGAILAWEEGA